MNRAELYNKLLLVSFERASNELGNDGVTKVSVFLSDYIFEVSNVAYGDKALRENYKKVKADEEVRIQFQQHVADALSRYLDFENFEDYVEKNKGRNPKKRKVTFNKWQIAALVIAIAVLVGYGIYATLNEQKWMVWNEDHYIEVPFDAALFEQGRLKLYKEERIEFFKKVSPDCDYDFFDSNGNVKIWYGKNPEKEYEYFTDLGLHPETDKTLKPISEYIISKYICK